MALPNTSEPAKPWISPIQIYKELQSNPPPYLEQGYVGVADVEPDRSVRWTVRRTIFQDAKGIAVQMVAMGQIGGPVRVSPVWSQ